VKNCRRNIAGHFLFAILFLPVLAIGILQVAEAYIEASREQRLKTEQLVTVTLPSEAVHWEEDEKELWVGDRMFDVSSFTIRDGYYHLTGVFDDDETEIAGSLLHFISSKKGSDLLHLLLLLQCFSVCLLLLELSCKKLRQKKVAGFYFALLPQRFYMVLGPPPRQ
jgi:hypothetical protein